MNKNISTDLIKELNHGLDYDKVSEYQILVLPENFDTETDKSKLIEGADALNISKLFKQDGVNCANSYDLDFDVPTLERRASDVWLGIIFILDSVVLPLAINIISNYIQKNISKSDNDSDYEAPNPKIHVEIKMNKKGKITKFNYDGDGETLVKVLKNLPND